MTENNFHTADLKIDIESGVVAGSKDSVRLGPVNMKVLQALLEKQGQVVSRSELFDTVWKNQIVSDDVLTRSISDLRSQLKRVSSIEKAIETIPKRGYRWLPKIEETAELIIKTEESQEFEEEHQAASQIDAESSSLKVSQLSVLVVALFVIFSAGVNWLVDHFAEPDVIRVALLPVNRDTGASSALANQVEDTLQTKLLSSQGFRFLSTTAVGIYPNTPYPNLAREFGTQWIIEAELRRENDSYQLSLSLVDAKTALVFYSLNEQVDESPQSVQSVCEQFLQSISEVLRDE